MAVFSHRVPAPVGKYSSFRQKIREDFRECCAYCLLHEIMLGGEESFEQDHHRPQRDFKHLVDEYKNMYWSCKVCNKNKSCHWPKPKLVKSGRIFIDTTVDDFATHFKELDDGTWHPLTKAAEYTLEKIRLNRKNLLIIRKALRVKSKEKSMPLPDWQNMTLKYIEDVLFK